MISATSRALLFVLCVAAVGSAGGCAAEKSVSNTFFAMDTAMVFTIYGKEREAALEACRREILRRFPPRRPPCCGAPKIFL